MKYLMFELFHVCRLPRALSGVYIDDALKEGFEMLKSAYGIQVVTNTTIASPSLRVTMHDDKVVVEVTNETKSDAKHVYRLQLNQKVECEIRGVESLQKFKRVESMTEWIDVFYYMRRKVIFKHCTGVVLKKFVDFAKRFYRSSMKEKEFKEWIEKLIAEHGDYYILESMKRKIVQITTHDHGFNAVHRAKQRLRDVLPFLRRLQQNTPPRSMRYLDVGSSEGNITNSVVDYFGLSKKQSFACDIVDGVESRKFQYAKVIDGKHIPFSGTFNLITMFMVNHHFEHWKEMTKSVRERCTADTLVIVREHNKQSDDHAHFYDLVHILYMCVINNETTIKEIIRIYNPATFCYYDSKSNWKRRFEEEGFEIVTSVDTHDRMDAFYLILRTNSA